MEDINILTELLKDSPLAVLVGFTIYQLTRVNSSLQNILNNQEKLVSDLIKKLTNDGT
jgi:hypothetical protein